MKTKLYTFLTGLLMAACITSYGQEIVSEFTYNNGQIINRCEIIEAADGSLMSGSHIYPDDTYENGAMVIYKFTLEGELVDSLPFPYSNYNALWATHPYNEDLFVFASFMQEAYGASFLIANVDAELNIIEEQQITFPDYSSDCTPHKVILDTQGDIVASYWDNDVFHMMRIGLDGTLKADKVIEGLYPLAQSKPDTTLYYSSIGVFNTTPQQFSLIGTWDRGYYTPWPVVGFTFDDDFNLIDTHFHIWYDNQVAFSGGMGEHMVPFDENSYLLASRMEYANRGHAALIKYSKNHEPLNFQIFDGNDPYLFNVPPCATKVMPDHTIYFSYLSHSTTGNSVVLVKLDEKLDIIWHCTIPSISGKAFGIAKITVLNDGRIVIGAYAWYQSYSKADLHIYIIEDNTTSFEETSSTTYPFTFSPNPVRDQLSLRFDDGAKPESVELYDLAGRLVGTKPNGLESIDMSAMPSGVYVLRVTMKDGTSYHEKILKE